MENLELNGTETRDTFESGLIQQFNDQLQMLERAHLLYQGEMVDFEKKKIKPPSTQALLTAIRRNRAALESKYKQGFTRLLVVPERAPLRHFVQALSLQIAKKRQLKVLQNSDRKPVLGAPSENKNVWCYNGFSHADENGKLVYYPRTFSDTPRDDGALYKMEIPPFRIVLIQSAANAQKLEHPVTPLQHMYDISNNRCRAHEVGITIETAITNSLSNIDESNAVTDDHVPTYALGNFLYAGRFVPIFGWNKDQSRAIIAANEPTTSDIGIGARTAVPIEIDND